MHCEGIEFGQWSEGGSVDERVMREWSDDMTLPPSERRNRDGPGAEPPQRLHGIASLPPSEESPRA